MNARSESKEYQQIVDSSAAFDLTFPIDIAARATTSDRRHSTRLDAQHSARPPPGDNGGGWHRGDPESLQIGRVASLDRS